MPSSWDDLKESLFCVFYLVTEQKMRHSKGVSFTLGAFRYGILYLVDAGQVISALVLPEFGWDSSVVTFLQRMDVIQLLFQVVRLVAAISLLDFNLAPGEFRTSTQSRPIPGWRHCSDRRFTYPCPPYARFPGPN